VELKIKDWEKEEDKKNTLYSSHVVYTMQSKLQGEIYE